MSPAGSAIPASAPAELNVKVSWWPLVRVNVQEPSLFWFNVAATRGDVAQKSVDVGGHHAYGAESERAGLATKVSCDPFSSVTVAVSVAELYTTFMPKLSAQPYPSGGVVLPEASSACAACAS